MILKMNFKSFNKASKT